MNSIRQKRDLLSEVKSRAYQWVNENKIWRVTSVCAPIGSPFAYIDLRTRQFVQSKFICVYEGHPNYTNYKLLPFLVGLDTKLVITEEDNISISWRAAKIRDIRYEESFYIHFEVLGAVRSAHHIFIIGSTPIQHALCGVPVTGNKNLPYWRDSYDPVFNKFSIHPGELCQGCVAVCKKIWKDFMVGWSHPSRPVGSGVHAITETNQIFA